MGLNDASKPQRSKPLAGPALRARYLAYVRDIAERWLDLEKLEPKVLACQTLLAGEVKANTRKLDSTAAFFSGATNDVLKAEGFRGPPSIRLKSFAEQRRAYLSRHSQVKPAGQQGPVMT